MNYNQNHKITQITSESLIVGVDIAKHNHVVRAQDFREGELLWIKKKML
ncbi:IS110 family transposase [Peribacillus simplex]|uniref:IS110 family transposase n=1 Tax=Peribacillus simplex TaxID=1478 RepID=A0A9X8ZDU8_9BACI|nr:IS110 family transposase [Peribacillus simplex]TKH03309.1 IS110 family transposase [Peribacillus simplex]TKH07940.1 IS110 family transposase [Peribacillus simplex]